VDNQLILVNVDGSNRRVITEGAVLGIGQGVYRPVFSPDGGLLAYSFGGLALYSVEGSGSNLVVQDRSDNDPLGRESYIPHLFSPDGTKLLVYMLHVDTSSVAINDLHANTLVRFPDKTDDDFACCGLYREVAWAPDSVSFYSSNPTPGMDAGGLWRVDAESGEVTTIVSYGGENNTFNFVDEPYATPDGQLYFFYSIYSGDLGPLHRAPIYLEIVRVAGDSTTEHTTLARSEALRMMNEALWAPDGSFVIVALAPSGDLMDGGQAEIVYFDGRPNVVLVPFAQEMKWGP
jgi:Tol biopolymer transport system component